MKKGGQDQTKTSHNKERNAPWEANSAPGNRKKLSERGPLRRKIAIKRKEEGLGIIESDNGLGQELD